MRTNRTRPLGSALRTAFGIAGVWTAVGLFRAADRYFSDPFQLRRLEFGAWEALAQSMLSAYIWAALTPLVVAVARRELPRRSRWARPVGVLLAASLVFPIAHAAAYQVAYPLLMGFPCVLTVQLASLGSLLPLSIPTQLVIFWAIVGATWTVTYAALSRERELRASQLETRLVSARLETLKMQLHPHFLFNTLHTISALMHRDVEKADRMMSNLGDLLRLSLDRAGRQEVSLREELEFLERYLEIQQTRFGDRLVVGMSVAPETLDARVPHLILQPLVENAVQHGIAPRAGAGKIEIRSRRRNGTLRLQVVDDGAGLPEGNFAREGLGLSNTRARLVQLYGSDHRFDMRRSENGGVAVTLDIPLRIERKEAVYGDRIFGGTEDSRPDR